MEKNTGHEIVAAKIIEQVENNQIPSLRKAAEASGYSPNHIHLVARKKTFHRALMEIMPEEWIALKTRAQTEAARIVEHELDESVTEEKMREICDRKQWEIVAMRRHPKTNNLMMVLLIPNYDLIDKTLDKLFKLLGLYQAEKVEITTPLEDLTDDEIQSQLVEEGQIVESGSNKP